MVFRQKNVCTPSLGPASQQLSGNRRGDRRGVQRVSSPDRTPLLTPRRPPRKSDSITASASAEIRGSNTFPGRTKSNIKIIRGVPESFQALCRVVSLENQALALLPMPRLAPHLQPASLGHH